MINKSINISIAIYQYIITIFACFIMYVIMCKSNDNIKTSIL